VEVQVLHKQIWNDVFWKLSFKDIGYFIGVVIFFEVVIALEKKSQNVNFNLKFSIGSIALSAMKYVPALKTTLRMHIHSTALWQANLATNVFGMKPTYEILLVNEKSYCNFESIKFLYLILQFYFRYRPKFLFSCLQ
jgi:hypothetical protein